jgi:hypothetical protein
MTRAAPSALKAALREIDMTMALEMRRLSRRAFRVTSAQGPGIGRGSRGIAGAAACRTTRAMTHPARVPEGDPSRAETADDVIRHAGVTAEVRDFDRVEGWGLTR